jgi:hypothetical protein
VTSSCLWPRKVIDYLDTNIIALFGTPADTTSNDRTPPPGVAPPFPLLVVPPVGAKPDLRRIFRLTQRLSLPL